MHIAYHLEILSSMGDTTNMRWAQKHNESLFDVLKYHLAMHFFTVSFS